MGWASAGEIFDPVAQALIDSEATPATKINVLSMLILQLQQGDWDTGDESLEQFQHDPAIVEAFRQQGVTLPCASCGETERYCECLDGWHR